MEWMEQKEKGQNNGKNVKHILVDLSCAAEGTEVIVNFGSHCCRATIIGILEWQPPKRHRKSKDACMGGSPHSTAQRRMKPQRAAQGRPKLRGPPLVNQ